jgi:cytochrome c oxidase subunit 2
MAFYVYADPPAVFQRWLSAQEKPAAAPPGSLAQQGERLFLDGACSTCHTIRGTAANGYTGPDLTHVGSRSTLAALAIPNTRSALAGWITHSQHVKPGNEMPNFAIGGRRLQALVSYLEGLR